MHKVVILIEPITDRQQFDDRWPDFLRHAEAMPGLLRESASTVERFLYGSQAYIQAHELYFDSLQAAQQALASPDGQQAGRILQQITGGRMTLFIADCREDDLANIRRFRQTST